METSRLLNLEFLEPLTGYTLYKLYDINKGSKLLLIGFPFNDILDYSKKFWHMSYDSTPISDLENQAGLRIRQNLLHNTYYKDLLLWIQKFRGLNISKITANTPTRHILDSVKNIDTVYEAWIFLEIVDFLYEKGMLLEFNLNEKYCKFLSSDKVITLWYEKGFYPLQHGGDGEHAWVSIHTPDFTVMEDNKILGVFDAKNYTESSISEPINKMLAYMSNLRSSLGVLFFPILSRKLE